MAWQMMKNTYLYSALLLLLTVSCGHRSYPQLLLTADSLAEVCPDSAIALLKTYAPQVKGQSTAVRNYYDLLCIKASDKAYIRNTTDSVILRLVDYYEHGGDKHLLPVAYYYAGRVYRDLNDAPQALEFFQKAVSLMVEPFYLKQKELTYNQMGHLFRRQRLDSDARKMYNKSFLCARQMNDTLMMIFNLRDIACIYDYKTEPDSSLPRFKQALHLSYSIHNEDMIASLETQLASFYIDREEYIKALEYMQHPLKHNNPKEHRALYIMMAHIYDGLGKTDSSFIYYRKLTQLDDIMAKQEGHRGLSEYYTVNQNLPDSCFCHLKQYRIAVDSLVKIRSVESVSQMNALYNYQLREKANATLKI
ncbi:MAG: amino acid ABC transporter permease, partial [Prevotella sp.]|nr:amino acid ABC transporter permease [Prevotella sp.]